MDIDNFNIKTKSDLVKTKQELASMREGGKILAQVLFEVLDHVRPGVSEIELDKLAEKRIREKGAEPAFKKVPGYRNTICVSVNDIVVHGIPTERTFKIGDVVGIDCGVFYKGLNTDMAHTIKIKSQKSNLKNEDEIDKFLETGKRALDEAIKVARPGNRIGNISKTIQDIVEGAGFSVVRTLVGHGVGKQLHEEPEVPGFIYKKIGETPKIVPGYTLAIEVIYNQGRSDVFCDKDGWTIRTQDRSLSGLFERTIAVTSASPVVLTN